MEKFSKPYRAMSPGGASRDPCVHARHWGSDAYLSDHAIMTEQAAEALVAAGVACVGIDSLNIDSTDGGARPVQTVLLRNDIPIVEHLTHLDQLPADGFTFTVRAYATVG